MAIFKLWLNVSDKDQEESYYPHGRCGKLYRLKLVGYAQHDSLRLGARTGSLMLLKVLGLLLWLRDGRNLELFGKVCYQSKFRASKRAEIFCLPLKLTNRIDEAFLLTSGNVNQE